MAIAETFSLWGRARLLRAGSSLFALGALQKRTRRKAAGKWADLFDIEVSLDSYGHSSGIL